MSADLPLTPAQRAMRASLASHTRWAGCGDRSAATAPAHAASPTSRAFHLRRVTEAAEAAGERPTDEVLAARAQSAHSAYMKRLAFRSSRARAARAVGRHRGRGTN